MIEATLVKPGREPASSTPAPGLTWRSPSVARPRQRKSCRYELSEQVGAFLRTKYLGAQTAGPASAADVRPFGRLHALSGTCSARDGSERSAETLRKVLVGAKLAVLAATLFVFAALAFSGEARADTVFAQGGFFTGEQLDQFSFNTPSAGTLSVTLSDLDGDLNSKLGLPADSFSPLSSLTLTLWSASGELGSCSLSMPCHAFTIAGPGTYYGTLDAVAGSNSLFPGLDIAIDSALGDFAPVPLPASVWLVLSGVAATLWSVRRRGARLAV